MLAADVGLDAEQDDERADHQQSRAQRQRLHEAADAALAQQGVDDEAQPQRRAEQQEGGGDVAERAQRLIEGVEAQDGCLLYTSRCV